jgi:methenyltetrahydrofolate cyclohydrolase
VEPASSFRGLTLGDFVARLSSAEPVPGGGSASAVSAALAASLVAMVASLSQGRPKYADHSALFGPVATEARALSLRLLGIADEDAAAFAGFAAALKLPRESDPDRARRAAAIRSAARLAADVPLRCVDACLRVVTLAEALAGRSNVNASSDLNVAALLAEAGGRGAAANVLVNLPFADDEAWAAKMRGGVQEKLDELSRLAANTKAVVAAGTSRDPIVAPGTVR